MPEVPACIRSGDGFYGGIVGYPLDRLYEEVAFIAYHFHWDHNRLLTLEHADRLRWVKEISQLNDRLNEESKAAG